LESARHSQKNPAVKHDKDGETHRKKDQLHGANLIVRLIRFIKGEVEIISAGDGF
jgi:hypothetical protein